MTLKGTPIKWIKAINSTSISIKMKTQSLKIRSLLVIHTCQTNTPSTNFRVHSLATSHLAIIIPLNKKTKTITNLQNSVLISTKEILIMKAEDSLKNHIMRHPNLSHQLTRNMIAAMKLSPTDLCQSSKTKEIKN